ncbi:HNH endonuclease signature motif containing protein [Streptomyces sp. NPDC096068]|uniref:HNH endonuclease signature motif containing protein n=1 Tax=Streptomyces sp. NPDC096068 TaxID=3155424 RepID=UPI0033332EFD
MTLADIGAAQVARAVEEFDRLGRRAFLERYGFGPSRTYHLVVDGRSYDSKAIVGAAHGFLPGLRPLKPSEFSGGLDHAVRVLTDLGFRVERSPAVGGGVDADTTADADTDRLVGRIAKLRVATTAGGPRLYQPITLLWAIGRALRGEPRLLSWEETAAALRKLLESHGLRGERPRPDYPVLALHRAGLWSLEEHTGGVPSAHGDAALLRWFAEQRPTGGLAEPVYALLAGSGRARVAVIEAIVDRFFDGVDEVPLLTEVGLYEDSVADDPDTGGPAADDPALDGGDGPVDPVVAAAQYEKWCAAVERREAREGLRDGVRYRERTVRDPVRSGLARQAVLARCDGRCENPGCQGQPDDVTDRWEPLLEVDHVVELAAGGRDHPSQMVALCPNCHAVKTRGRTRHRLREVLLEVALERHRRGPLPS